MSKYNLGSISKPTIDATSHVGTWTWGRVRLSIFSLPLSDSARLLLAWADAQEPSCIPTVAKLKEAFGWGKDKWRAVAMELEGAGWLSQKRWAEADGSTRHELKISLLQLAELSTAAQNPPITCACVMAGNPPLTREGGQTRPSRDGGVTRPLYLKGIEEPIPTPRASACDGGGAVVSGLESDGGLPAVPSRRPTGLGERLADLLPQAQLARVDHVSAGASPTQLEAAEAAVRRAVRRGAARNVVSYSLDMAARAACGRVALLVDTPAPVHNDVELARRRALLERRAAHASWRIHHPALGALEAVADGRGWRGSAGVHIGAVADAIWEDVDAGRLILRPPDGAEASRRAHPLGATRISRQRGDLAAP